MQAIDIAGTPLAVGPVYAALSDMEVGGRGILGEFDMPEFLAEQLMNLGFVPGLEVMVAQSGPGGDPRVYRVDGVEVALRGELAKLIAVAPKLEISVARSLSLRDKDGAPLLPTRSSSRDGEDAAGTAVLRTQEASAD